MSSAVSIPSYWLNESRNLKIHVQYLKSRIFDKVHLKVCFIRYKTVTEGLEVVRVQMGGKTAFGEPNNKGQQMISTPPKVLLF